MYVTVNEEGRITAIAEKREYLIDGAFEFDFPSDFDFDEIGEYLIKDGELVYSESRERVLAKIESLKAKLLETDYVVAKISEASLIGGDVEALVDQYSDIIKSRNKWRREINDLETDLECKEC